MRAHTTAAAYCILRRNLQDDASPSDILTPRLTIALEWIESAGIVEWLVPAPDYVAANWHTFKDCETVLTVLEVAAINLPAPPPHGSELIWIFVGPDDWCDSKTAHRSDAMAFGFTEFAETLARGDTPSRQAVFLSPVP